MAEFRGEVRMHACHKKGHSYGLVALAALFGFLTISGAEAQAHEGQEVGEVLLEERLDVLRPGALGRGRGVCRRDHRVS